MAMPRHYRRSRRGPRSIVRTYKKVLNFAPASSGAGTKVDFDITFGVDSLAIGQTGPTDNVVPTGAIVDYIEFQYGVVNLAATANFTHISIQSLLSGQAATVSPNVVGGNPQRNQVFYQMMRSNGQGQNSTYVIKWRVPKMMQRMREGSRIELTVLNTAAVTHSLQVIYKVKQ